MIPLAIFLVITIVLIALGILTWKDPLAGARDQKVEDPAPAEKGEEVINI